MAGTARRWCGWTLTGATLAGALAAGAFIASPALRSAHAPRAAATTLAEGMRDALRLVSGVLPMRPRAPVSGRAVVPTMGIRD